jgi:lambda family phage tail tape measure protein
LVGAFAGFAYAAKQIEDFNRSLGQMQAVLKATGRGDLFPGLKTTIDRLVLLPGVSREIATKTVNELVRIPQLAAPVFTDLAKIVGDYARLTGQELPDAAKSLGQAFADPAKGAEQLDKVLGNLSAETLLTIKALTEQGRVVEAQGVLYEELSRKIQGLATDGLTELQKSTNQLGVAWERLKQSLGDSTVFGIPTKAADAMIDKLTGLVNSVYIVNRLIDNALGGGGGGGGGIATASGARLDRDAAAAITEELNKQVKAQMAVTGQYVTQGKKADDLVKQQQAIVKLLGNIESAGQSGNFEQSRARLIDQIKAIQQQIDSGNKKGSKEKAYQDDAAERQLLSLREQEASLRAQLVATEDLTTQQQELARFEQQIADLKEKNVLTADQKILLQNEDQLRLQLQINSALSVGLQAKEDAAKAAKKEADELERQREKAAQMLTDFLAASEAMSRTLAERNRSRGEAFGDMLAGAGAGRGARQQIVEQIQLVREFDRARREATERAAEKGLLGSALYRDDLAKIDAAQQEALAMQRAYWDEWNRLQGDWRVGANEAMNNYLDEIADVARQVDQVFTNAFQGMEDALVDFVTTGKLNFKSLADSILADITRIIIRQQITGPLAQSITGTATAGGLLSDLLGALFGGTRAGGGPAYAGSAYLVGEDGPELFMPRTSGTVIPTGQTAAMLGGKSIVYSPVFHIPAPTDMRTQQQIAAKAFSGFQMAAARHT